MTAVRIAAEVRDVLANPAQRRHQVGHADIDRVFICRAADLGQIEESEQVEAVIHRDRNGVVMPRQLRAVLRGQFVGRAEGEAAAVKVDQHRTFAGQRGRPDIQLEHVFAHVAVVPIVEEGLLDRGVVVQALRAVGAVDQSGIFAVPRLGSFGRKPAIFAARYSGRTEFL